ncbi:hypothetical protein IWZ01DRAFT_575642, partial [Phyllosticta capitalensis]
TCSLSILLFFLFLTHFSFSPKTTSTSTLHRQQRTTTFSISTSRIRTTIMTDATSNIDSTAHMTTQQAPQTDATNIEVNTSVEVTTNVDRDSDMAAPPPYTPEPAASLDGTAKASSPPALFKILAFPSDEKDADRESNVITDMDIEKGFLHHLPPSSPEQLERRQQQVSIPPQPISRECHIIMNTAVACWMLVVAFLHLGLPQSCDAFPFRVAYNTHMCIFLGYTFIDGIYHAVRLCRGYSILPPFFWTRFALMMGSNVAMETERREPQQLAQTFAR